jgi:hypothetical protein
MFSIKLDSPYPLNESFKERTIKSVIFGVFVSLFLVAFRPFDMDALKNHLLLVSLGYGMVCSVVMFILNILVFNALPNYFSETQWTIKRELIWSVVNLLSIASGNFIYSIIMHITAFNFGSFLLFIAYTLAVGIFPITVVVMIKFSRWRHKYEAESQVLNPIIEAESNIIHHFDSHKLKFFSDNGSLELELMSSDFLYAKADDNYVEVHYLQNGKKHRKILRNTLKNTHGFLPMQENFYRCHKSYVVNLDLVNHISGNAQGYKFHLKYTDELIPVSRSNNEFVKNYFTNHPKTT